MVAGGLGQPSMDAEDNSSPRLKNSQRRESSCILYFFCFNLADASKRLDSMCKLWSIKTKHTLMNLPPNSRPGKLWLWVNVPRPPAPGEMLPWCVPSLSSSTGLLPTEFPHARVTVSRSCYSHVPDRMMPLEPSLSPPRSCPVFQPRLSGKSWSGR